MATRLKAEPVVALPPALAFALGVPAAPRSAVEAVIERMIAALDDLDGCEDDEDGADAEQTGDESEPDFAKCRKRDWRGPGCPISDPDYGVEDFAHDGDRH